VEKRAPLNSPQQPQNVVTNSAVSKAALSEDEFVNDVTAPSGRVSKQKPCIIGSWPLLIASTFFFTTSIVVFSMASLPKPPVSDSAPKSASYHSPNVIYGHVHLAKTAGTNINGNLSMHYERICGHKGYSYDAFEFNERSKNNVKRIGGSNFIRGLVPINIMDEIGYQDCDWISLETFHWEEWLEFENWTIPMELHVPCRHPVDHLMSQCNWRLMKFDCNKTGKAIIYEIEKCISYVSDRYNKKLNETFAVKCFDFRKTSQYMEWIGTVLQKKRIEADYVFRATNAPRHKQEECLSNRPDIQEVVEQYLVEKYDYYRFCKQCLGSNNDLLAS